MRWYGFVCVVVGAAAGAVTASGSTAVVSCGGFEVHKSIDGGLTWSQVSGVGQLDGRRLSADAASDGGVYGLLTSDSGLRGVVMRRSGGVWTRLTIPQSYSIPPVPREVCASPTTSGTVFVAVDGFDSSILRSTDLGAVWGRFTLSSLRNFLVDGLALNPSDGEVGLLAVSPDLTSAPMCQAFHRTSNPGAWSEMTIPDLDPVIGQAGGCAIRGAQSPTYYIGGPWFDTAGGKVIKSTNAGTTWTTCGASVIPSDVLCITVDSDSGTNIAVGTRADGVWASKDDGASFVAAGLTGKAVNGLHWDRTTLYAAASDGIYATTDWGQNWTQVGSALTGVRCFSIVRSGDSLFAGVDGRGIWRFDL